MVGSVRAALVTVGISCAAAVAATVMIAPSASAAQISAASAAPPAAAAAARAAVPAASGVRRNIYVSETGCVFAGDWGILWGNWDSFYCQPTDYWDSETGSWTTWYVLYTNR
jgi:hypothetical protein